MRAIVLDRPGGGEGFRMVELPVPPLRPGEVRIAVQAVGFNPVDVQLRRSGVFGTQAGDRILGRDLSGVVEAVAEGVADLRPGDRVYANVCRLASSGSYAERVAVPAELVARRPASLDALQAAAVPVAGVTATLALDGAAAGAGRSLFVAGGAGGVGSMALSLARRRGIECIVATAGRAESRAHLRDTIGLRDAQIVDPRHGDLVAAAMAANGGAFDAALDLVGGAMLSACCRLLAVDGRVASAVDGPTADDAERLFERNASFHAVGAHAWSLSNDRRDWGRYRDLLETLTAAFDDASLAAPTVSCVGDFSVETVRRAHALLEAGAVRGKLAMTVS